MMIKKIEQNTKMAEGEASKNQQTLEIQRETIE
jgi:hypothetical protein